MTKSTITRERLQEIAEDGFLKHGESKELARMALAAMDSEPVGYFGRFDPDDEDIIDQCSKNVKGSFPLYRHAQPAPVVPEEWTIADAVKFCKETGRQDAGAAMDAWNACRAAMLQAGTLTNEGTKQAWTGIPDIDNAINMLDRIDTLESCDDDRIEAVKTVLRGLAGNPPVIGIDLASGPDRTVEVRYVAPPGYVMVPKEPTEEMLQASYREASVYSPTAYRAMIAAAPQEAQGE